MKSECETQDGGRVGSSDGLGIGFKIVEWGLNLPYRLPQRTKLQRLVRTILFVPVFLASIPIVVVAGPIGGIAALVDWIMDGE